jgi:ribokinase
VPHADEPRPSVSVVGVGAAAWDRFLIVPRTPRPDDKLRVLNVEECAGGTVATALVALARWGVGCRILATLGDDPTSGRLAADLATEGVDATFVVRAVGASCRRSTILVDERDGRRSVLSEPHRLPPLSPERLTHDLFDGARVLHLDTTVDECAVEAAMLAASLGLKVTLDAERVTPRIRELLPLCDFVIASRPFAEELTGQSKLSRLAYALHLQSGRPTVVTSGPEGCEYASADEQFAQPAFETVAVDTTAAGDVFHAGFIFGALAGWDMRTTVRFAAWAGAAACREVGGRKGVPTLAAVKKFLHEDRA